jgi:hypothetical protein
LPSPEVLLILEHGFQQQQQQQQRTPPRVVVGRQRALALSLARPLDQQ